MSAKDKEPWLERLLRKRETTALIFVKTKKRAEELGRQLQRAKLPADSIHGDKSAESRHVVLKAFERGKVRFLVATDVAARGIDVSDIGTVINFDMPRALEDYVHRVGRTGRAGSEGEALSLVGRPDRGMLKQILQHLERSSDGHARAVLDGEVVLKPKRAKAAPESAPAPAPRETEPAERAPRESRPRDRRAASPVVELTSRPAPPVAEGGFGVGVDGGSSNGSADRPARKRGRRRSRADA